MNGKSEPAEKRSRPNDLRDCKLLKDKLRLDLNTCNTTSTRKKAIAAADCLGTSTSAVNTPTPIKFFFPKTTPTKAESEFAKPFEEALRQLQQLQTPLHTPLQASFLDATLAQHAPTPQSEKLNDLLHIMLQLNENDRKNAAQACGAGGPSISTEGREQSGAGREASSVQAQPPQLTLSLPNFNQQNSANLFTSALTNTILAANLLSPVGGAGSGALPSTDERGNVVIPLMVSSCGQTLPTAVSLATVSGNLLFAAQAASTARFQQHLSSGDANVSLAPILQQSATNGSSSIVVPDPSPSVVCSMAPNATAVPVIADCRSATPPVDPVSARTASPGIANSNDPATILVSSRTADVKPKTRIVVRPVATHPGTGVGTSTFLLPPGSANSNTTRLSMPSVLWPGDTSPVTGGEPLMSTGRPAENGVSKAFMAVSGGDNGGNNNNNNVDVKQVLQAQVLDPHSQEQLKIERKRARNRLAATRCRTRKLERIKMLEGQVRVLEGEMKELAEQLRDARRDKVALQKVLNDHKLAGCPVPLPGTL